MRICALLALLAVLGSGCGGASSPPPTPSSTTAAAETAAAVATAPSPPFWTSTPAPIPTPAPILRTSGWMIFLRGKDLWVAKLDGSNERQITTESRGAGFAGYTRDAAGRVELYYTSEVALAGADSPSPPTGAEFVLYRTPLDGGPIEELASLPNTMQHDENWATVASVSPDGKHIAYIDERGLNRFDLESGRSVLLLGNAQCGSNESTVVSTCYGYYQPAWSPRGDLLLAMKHFYEGAQPVGVQPFKAGAPPLEFGDRSEFDQAAWSPDGGRLCLVPFNYSEAVAVIAVDGNQRIDLEPAVRIGRFVPVGSRVQGGSCAWAADGRLAMQYLISPELTAGRVAVFGESLAFRLDVTMPEVREGPPNVVAWLPDGTGFLVWDWDVTSRDTRVSVVMLDGTTRSLPFVANRVLAVLP